VRYNCTCNARISRDKHELELVLHDWQSALANTSARILAIQFKNVLQKILWVAVNTTAPNAESEISCALS
jgi:hypothetical protein